MPRNGEAAMTPGRALPEGVERVLVVTVDPRTGEILDASVQPLEGFIRALAEAAEAGARRGEPARLAWRPSATWWRPERRPDQRGGGR